MRRAFGMSEAGDISRRTGERQMGEKKGTRAASHKIGRDKAGRWLRACSNWLGLDPRDVNSFFYVFYLKDR